MALKKAEQKYTCEWCAYEPEDEAVTLNKAELMAVADAVARASGYTQRMGQELASADSIRETLAEVLELAEHLRRLDAKAGRN